MLKTTLIMMLAISLAACKNNTASNNDANIDTMQTTNTEKQTNIKGTASNIYVDDAGTGGIPILFVHSFGGNTEHWKNQLSHLRSNRRAIAMDLRGHGKSTAPANNDYSATAMAEDIAAVVDALKLDKVILVGHSAGGAAAVTYTGMHPDKIAGLIMAGTPGQSNPKMKEQIIAALESDAYQKTMDDYMKQLTTNAKPEVAKMVTEGTNRVDKPTSIKIVKAMFDFDPVPSLNKYSGPMLIIATPAEAKQPGSMHALRLDVPYKQIDGTSHWTQLDKPDEFNKILDEFIAKVDSINAK